MNILQRRSKSEIGPLESPLDDRFHDGEPEPGHQYFMLLEHLPEIVFQIDSLGHWQRLNQAWTQITGFSSRESVGQKVLEFVHSEDQEKYGQWLRSLLESQSWASEPDGSPCSPQVGRYRTRSGEFRWLELSAQPLLAPDGKVTGLVGMLRNVTQAQQLAADLAELTHLRTLSQEITGLFSQGNPLPTLLEGCAAQIASWLDAASVRIWTHNTRDGLLELQAIIGQYSPGFPSSVPIGISLVGLIAQNRQPYLSHDVHHDLCLDGKPWMQKEGIVAFAGYPLIVEAQVVGVMALFTRRSLSDAVQQTLQSLSQTMAVGIDRMLAQEALLSRREGLLFRLASQIRDSLDLDQILAAAVNEILSLLRIDGCYFLWCWPDPDSPSLTITHEALNPGLPSLLGDLPMPQADALARRVMNLAMLKVDHLEAHTPLSAKGDLDEGTLALLQQFQITALLLLPLETRSGQLGALICSCCQGSHDWLESEIELLRAVTDQLAIAIGQADLYAQSRATALAAQNQAKQLNQTLNQLKQAQGQLIQHEKMSSLGQLVAGIAHEINNPVNFIHGNIANTHTYLQGIVELLQLYQKYHPTPEPEIQAKAEDIDIDFIVEDLPKLLSSMQVGTDRICQIVLSLRNFSRLDEAQIKVVNLHEGLDNTLLILQHRLKAHPHRAAIQVIKEYGDLPQVECFAGPMNQVFMNILSNAIDALEEAFLEDENSCPTLPLKQDTSTAQQTVEVGLKPTITIQTMVVAGKLGGAQSSEEHEAAAPAPSPWDKVVIRIRDNGLGIPEAVRSRLFDPFFTTKPIGKGTGLGLSISYQIITETHHGSLECFSDLGRGAEFWIQIPTLYHQ